MTALIIKKTIDMKRLKLILILIVIISIAVVLILNKFLIYGIILIGLALGIYFIWDLLIKQRDKHIEELKKKNELKDEEIAAKELLIKELEQRKINISQIAAIFEIGLLEVDSSFTRVVNNNSGKLKFFGALRIDIKAKYGIDLKEVRFKFDNQNNKILVYNLNPKFLSFSKRNCDWLISETMELVERTDITKFFGAEDYWRTKGSNDRITMETCEKIRKKTELELENGPEEFKWITEPLKNQIINTLKILFFTPNTEICLAEIADETFVDIKIFLESKFVFDNQKKLMN